MAESVPSRVTCEQATALLLDYVSGTLDPATALLLERHLARCDDCVPSCRHIRDDSGDTDIGL